jgi:transcriptional regulator with XRE-family HTH domain
LFTAHTASTPAIAELDVTVIHYLGDLPVAERDESIGARISQLRKDKGMTQKELAGRLEVSQPVVSDYENGVIRLPADIVGKIAQVLEVTSDELLGLEREACSSGDVKNRRLSRRLQAIDALPKRDQEALWRTIDAFISKTASGQRRRDDRRLVTAAAKTAEPAFAQVWDNDDDAEYDRL